MIVHILCSDSRHPVYEHLIKWRDDLAGITQVNIFTEGAELSGGDYLFLISASEILPASICVKYFHSFVIHESAVPEGRGWSPLVWQILEGKNQIPFTLMEVAERVDSGDIWSQAVLELDGCELYGEIMHKAACLKIEMMCHVMANIEKIKPIPQDQSKATFYPRRSPNDSRLDSEKSIADQFNLLRVADPQRFPSFFDFQGVKYILKLEKDVD